MAHTLISKLKPNFLDISELKYDILISKKQKCALHTNFASKFPFFSFFFIKGDINSVRKELLSKIEWKEGLSLLFVSINEGDDLLYIPKNINQKSLSIVGIDISFSNLKYVKNLYENRFNLSLLQCCAQELPFLDSQFDAVICIGGFNKYKNSIKTAKEFLRVAKPNGKILIADRYSKDFKFQEKLDKLEREILKLTYECNINLVEKEKFYTVEFIKE